MMGRLLVLSVVCVWLFFRLPHSYCHESKTRKGALKPQNKNRVKREKIHIIILIINVFHAVITLYFPFVFAS